MGTTYKVGEWTLVRDGGEGRVEFWRLRFGGSSVALFTRHNISAINRLTAKALAARKKKGAGK